MSQLVARGATQLGPTVDKSGTTILRDPGGAVVALTQTVAWPSEPIVWHQLHTVHAQQAAANYTEIFGWSLTGPVELGEIGTYEQFAWESGGPSVGAIGDIAGRPELHPHWLFFLPVKSLGDALASVTERGGKIVGQVALPSGDHLAVCEDPQGAEFGIIERP